MIFEIKKKLDNEYDIKNDIKMINRNKLVYKINQKYNDYNKIFQIINKYEFLYPYLLRQSEESHYKYYFEYFKNINEYYLRYIKRNNLDYFSLLKYNPSDKYFTSYFELFSKFYKKFNISNNTKILEISNTTFGCEALGFINDELYFDIFLCETKDDELLKRLNIISRTLKKKKIDKINILNNLKNDKKYDIIILSPRAYNQYWTTPYSLYSSNKIRILYLLKSLMMLTIDGNIIMRYYNYNTNVSKQIYYLFRRLFKKTKLYIPETNLLYYNTGGFIIGFNFLGLNNIDFNNIIQELEQFDDNNISINNIEKFYYQNNENNYNFLKYNNDNIIINEYNDILTKNDIEKINKINNNNNPNIYSFYNIEENDIYNKKLDKYYNKYIDSVLYDLNNIDHYLNNQQELINLKISKAITWCNKYKFDIQEDFSYFDFSKDYINDLIKNVNLYNDYNTISSFKYSSKNNSFNYNKFINKIIKLNKKHELIANYIDTRDFRVYRKVRLDFDPFYHKIKNYIKINLDKRYLNQPFFKLYEMLELYKFTLNKTFSFCELPGSFIFSLQYFIKTKTNITNYQWKAQSLNEPNIAKLDDSFNMLKKYKNNYDMGPKNNGNLLYDYNLDYYEKLIIKENYDLITVDCGMPLKTDTCEVMNGLESKILLLIIKTQKDGIVKIVYPFQNNDKENIIMIGLICKCYKEVYFYKSPQCYTSNEFYFIFKHFNDKDKIFDKIKNNILELEELLDKDFYYSFYKIYKKLLLLKIRAINYKLYLVDRYDIITKNDNLNNYMIKKNNDILDEWIKRFNFK